MSAPADRNAVLHLRPSMFGESEVELVRAGAITVSSFRYASGVEALRLTSDRVQLVLLPFRGQQVWRYRVDGEELTMRTHFDEPTASTTFGETYGGFLLHCGLSGIGAPGPEDAHAHHGELPNARYDSARLLIDRSDGIDRVALSGTCRLRVSHCMDLLFEPTLTLRADATELSVRGRVRNLRRDPFQYSYLCHLNWALPDSGRLAQTVPLDAGHFTVAPHPQQDERTARLTAAIAADPSVGDQASIALPVVPEYCAVLRPVADADGWAHFLMQRGDGSAASVSYPVAELPYAIRWISNTGDEQASGFCLPATGAHFGRHAAEVAGQLRTVPGHGEVAFELRVDLLDEVSAAAGIARIRELVGG